ncbi:MAG: alpha/beta fold hydrolase [Gammaproteobacteria bacterium]
MQDNTMRLHDGRNLGFSEYGKPEGIPLFLFHGTPGSRLFPELEQAAWIQEYGIRVITPERPGYGLSSPAPGRSISDWASDVEELADHLGLDSYHVAGGSGGGPFALACAIHSSARVLSVTLISSGGPPEVMRISKDMQLGNRIAFFVARYAPFLLKVLLANNAKVIKKRPDKFMAAMTSKLPEWDKRMLEKRCGEASPMHVQEAFRQGADGAYRDMLLVSHPWHLNLDAITVPIFLWHGTADILVPVATAQEFSKLIPGCEPHFIPDAGHMLLSSEDVASQMMSKMVTVGA